MTSCSNIEIRRCRPLLGTFVEMTATHADAAQAQTAINAAFAAVERVQQLMSFHDPQSEVSQLNRLAVSRPVCVSDWTYEVLGAARGFHDRTGGVFDIAVAPELMRWGLLPRHSFYRSRVNHDGRTSDLTLLPGRMVRFLRPMQIDLGGIAKGFAMDQAVNALRANGVATGLVNAGGDLRCFGEQEQRVWVRHPRAAEALLPLPTLKNTALATSANSYQRRCRSGRPICAQVHGRTRRPCLRSFSVSVSARTCLIADALTKVVLALGRASAQLLAELRATAFIVRADGRMTCSGGVA
jgi:thiamine biosynthesis lipoprotein